MFGVLSPWRGPIQLILQLMYVLNLKMREETHLYL